MAGAQRCEQGSVIDDRAAADVVETGAGLHRRQPRSREQAARLREQDIDLRVFILVQPPFVPADEAVYWAERSIDFAFECNAAAMTLIPTRGGNGAMELLQQAGDFTPPSLRTLEASVEYGIRQGLGRVFADLWNIEQIVSCLQCQASRINRLQKINLTQTLPARVECASCGGGA